MQLVVGLGLATEGGFSPRPVPVLFLKSYLVPVVLNLTALAKYA